MVSEVYVMVVIEGGDLLHDPSRVGSLKGYKQGITKVPSGTKSILTHILGNMSNHKYPV